MSYHYRFVGLEPEEFPSLAGELSAGFSLVDGSPIEYADSDGPRGNAVLEPGEEIVLTAAVVHPRLEPLSAEAKRANEVSEPESVADTEVTYDETVVLSDDDEQEE